MNNDSESLEPSLRLGMRMVSGFREEHAQAIMETRRQSPFFNIADFTKRTRLGSAVITKLSEADAFHSVDHDRRSALWQALAQEQKPLEQPLFDSLNAEDDSVLGLPAMPLDQQVVEDYQSVGLSLKAHPISFHRERLNELKVVQTAELKNKNDNQYLRVAGLVILRQRPATAKGITFVTIEDETGTANLVVKQKVWERFYRIARSSPAWIAQGKLEKKNGVIHVVANRLQDLSASIEDHNIRARNFR